METDIRTIHEIWINRYVAGLHLPQTTKKGMLSCQMAKGVNKLLEACTVPRLFFLLKGKAQLSGESCETHTIHKQTFTLLPPGNNIHMEVLTDIYYILVYCHPFSNMNNKEYIERIKKYHTQPYPPLANLPIRGTLGTLLHSYKTYMNEELLHSPLFDALFVLMRALYTPEELATVFLRMKQIEYEI